jgi:hypothetical protein
VGQEAAFNSPPNSQPQSLCKIKLTMRHILPIFTFLIISVELLGQTEKVNSIYLEYYQPIQTPAMREFYNDEWILTPGIEYKRHYFSNAFGLCYEIAMKNNIILRPRIGMTIRSLDETNLTKIWNGQDTAQFDEVYKYRQNQINCFVGVGKRLPIFKNFNIDCGLDIAFIYYGHGNTNYYSKWSTIDTNGILQLDTEETWWTNKVGTAYAIGVGPYIKPEYQLAKNFIISLEVQFYYLWSFSKDKSVIETRHRFNYNQVGYYEETNSKAYTNYDFSQWSWSRLSPLIRIGYRF